MTTWQDQQPLSRRALRESERAHAQVTMSDTGDVDTGETRPDQQIWRQPLTAEPLDYTTQSRRPVPVEEPPLRRPRSSSPSRDVQDAPSYRVRDFSPEGRGTSFSSTTPAPWTPPAEGSGDLNYHTSVEFNRAAPTAFDERGSVPPVVVTPAAPTPAAQPPATQPPATPALAPVAQPGHPTEHTLTRREMRELRNASRPDVVESAPPQSPLAPRAAATAPLVSAAPTPSRAPQPEPSPELAAAMAEFDAFMLATSPPPLVEPAHRPTTGPPAAVPAAAAPAVDVQPRPAEAAPVQAAPAPPMPAPPEPPSIRLAPAAPASVSPAAASPMAPIIPDVPAEPLREIVTAPEVYAAPAGHWAAQLTIDEQYVDVVGAHSRNLAASDAITTNALVLPAFPQTGPLTGPVSRTGEILLTGSIDLPRSLGLSGLNPARYDRPDIDAVIDAGDREDSAPDSAPVRAIRAVSTHTSSQGIINARRPKGSSLPMILSITAGVMAVGVIILFVAGMIFKIF